MPTMMVTFHRRGVDFSAAEVLEMLDCLTRRLLKPRDKVLGDQLLRTLRRQLRATGGTEQ